MTARNAKPVVAILGLGQIGGSLAAALTRRRLATVVGIARRPVTVRRALRMGIVSRATRSLHALEEADVAVLATPVRTLLGQLPEALRRVGPHAVLTDVGSTKQEIVAAARHLRPCATVVGGHPMAGNERAGLDGCDPDLFEGRPWILVPAVIRRRESVALLERLVRGVGARLVRMGSAAEHDMAIARISHIPYLLAYALCELPESAQRLAGNSFRDATRVALSDPGMVLDFLLTNRGPIAKAGGEFLARFREFSKRLAKADEPALRRWLSRARERRSGL